MLVPAENRNSPRAPQMAKPGGLPCRGGTMSHHAIPPNVAPRPTTKAADASVNSAKRVRRNAQRLHPKQSATSLPPPLRPPAAVGKEKSRPGRRKWQSPVASPAGVTQCGTQRDEKEKKMFPGDDFRAPWRGRRPPQFVTPQPTIFTQSLPPILFFEPSYLGIGSRWSLL